MAEIILAFAKIEEGKRIKNTLIRHGHHILSTAGTGLQAIQLVAETDCGILISGYRFPDMLCTKLREDIDEAVDMLVIAPSNLYREAVPGIVHLPSPLMVYTLVDTVAMMDRQSGGRKRRKKGSSHRTASQEEILSRAKNLLFDRNGMGEEEAHRYIQKLSMDQGVSMVETAQKIIALKSLY